MLSVQGVEKYHVSCVYEVKFGFTYATLDKYIRGIEVPEDDIREKIDRMHERNLFKLNMPEAFVPEM